MSRRKIRTRPKIKKPHFFERDEWMKFRDTRSKSKRKKTEEAVAKEAKEAEECTSELKF